MRKSVDTQLDILSLTLDGFEGPIDLLLNLVRDHKIDLSKPVSYTHLTLPTTPYV